MKKQLLTFLLIITCAFHAFCQNPKREIRAVWITTHLSLDWPTTADPTATKQSKLLAMLDNLKAVGINTIYFQVRGVADAFYPSALVPWSNRLTGVYGADPGWDPLAFAVNACHDRGMEIHAWLNPYRAATSDVVIPSYSSNHKAKTNPDWLLEYNNAGVRLKYFNPALQAVRNHITDVVNELVDGYDLDGIHFDDYFYYAGLGTQDAANYTADPRGFTNIDDWRRDNVTLLIKQLNTSIKARKSWVKFGISPSGIYRNHPTDLNTGTPTTGSQHYSVQFADTKKWMQEGLIDYLAPQIYWAFSQVTANAKFNIITDFWNLHAYNRHLFIGLATYRTNDGTASQYTTDEIKNQLNYLRSSAPNLLGAAHFRAAHTVSTNVATKATMESIRDNQYQTPAIIPAMTWIDNTPPDRPLNLVSTLETNQTKLTWDPPANTTDELQQVKRYAVYRSTNATIDFENASNLIGIVPASSTSFIDQKVTPGQGTIYYYAVRSLDRISNESLSSNSVVDAVTLPVELQSFTANRNGNRVKIDWVTTSERNSDYFLIERAGDDGQFHFLEKKQSSLSDTELKNQYSVWDNKPLVGMNYYRLTQYDKNGTASIPKSTYVNFNDLIVVNATVFPNPTKQDIKFSLENFVGKTVKTKLLNLYGQVLHEEEFSTLSGNNQFQLNLKNKLPKGNYILTLSDFTFQKHVKLIVL